MASRFKRSLGYPETHFFRGCARHAAKFSQREFDLLLAVEPVDQSAAHLMGMKTPQGALVASVDPDGPAGGNGDKGRGRGFLGQRHASDGAGRSAGPNRGYVASHNSKYWDLARWWREDRVG